MCWQGGAGSMVDGGGVTGSGRKGTTTGERLPEIKPSFWTKFLLLSGLGWKKPSRKPKIKPFLTMYNIYYSTLTKFNTLFLKLLASSILIPSCTGANI